MAQNISRPVRPKLVPEFLARDCFALSGLVDFVIQTRGVAPDYHITGFQPSQARRNTALPELGFGLGVVLQTGRAAGAWGTERRSPDPARWE